MIQNDVCGIQVEEDDAEVDYEGYGIDWEEFDYPAVREHHNHHNPDPLHDDNNPFIVNHPNHLSHVDLSDPRCPFNADQIAVLDAQIILLPSFNLHDMHSRRLTWINALQLATNI
jgi:hypothetical protein